MLDLRRVKDQRAKKLLQYHPDTSEARQAFTLAKSRLDRAIDRYQYRLTDLKIAEEELTRALDEFMSLR